MKTLNCNACPKTRSCRPFATGYVRLSIFCKALIISSLSILLLLRATTLSFDIMESILLQKLLSFSSVPDGSSIVTLSDASFSEPLEARKNSLQSTQKSRTGSSKIIGSFCCPLFLSWLTVILKAFVIFSFKLPMRAECLKRFLVSGN